MTGNINLDWALVGVSVFNVILQLWLGLTVLLNAERRSWGVWLMGGGLLLGAAFFISHTAILGQELFFGANVDGLNFWWQIGWVPVMGAPFAWYIVILWYAGFWNSVNTRLRKRHRWLVLMMIDMAVGLAFLMIFVHPIPTYEQIIMLDLSTTLTINGIPILFTLFPIFMILCLVFSIDALRRPEPADRLMGDLARERSRPWLVAAAVTLLAVSVLVTFFIYQVFRNARVYNPVEMSITRIAIYDLILESLVALAVILLGRAVVSYEVFTGKVLPRRGFFRQWRTTILLAAGYAFVIGWSLAIQLRPIYSLLLSTLLMVIFYALYNWRSFLERERFMERLRPFVSSQGLMQQLVSPEDEAISNASAMFAAVCRDVLDATEAHLIPSGSLSPLVGGALTYPPSAHGSTVQPSADLLTGAYHSIIPLNPADYDSLRWAIPLWAERGRIGVLLLGTKSGGGLYTQEEIEIARAGGERIIDMLAGEQMARRLMLLQRGRLTESRVMDRRTRRALHDETLPTLHAALLKLSSLPRDNPAVHDAIQSLTAVHQQVADLIHTVGGVSAPMNGGSNLTDLLRHLIETEFGDEFNTINWKVDDHLPPVDPIAQEVIAGAVREAARNAAVHGRGGKPERPLNLTICIAHRDGLTVTVSDDGVGLDGSSPRPASDLPAGSGGGLILHSTMLAILGGSLTVENGESGGVQVVVRLPVSAKSPMKSS